MPMSTQYKIANIILFILTFAFPVFLLVLGISIMPSSITRLFDGELELLIIILPVILGGIGLLGGVSLLMRLVSPKRMNFGAKTTIVLISSGMIALILTGFTLYKAPVFMILVSVAPLACVYIMIQQAMPFLKSAFNKKRQVMQNNARLL